MRHADIRGHSVLVPSPGAPNPTVGAAGNALREWAGRFGLLADTDQRIRLAKARPEYVAAHLYPTAPLATLTIAAQWLAVNFVIDDMLDDEGDTSRCQSIVDEILALFGSGASTVADPVRAAIAELWGRTATGRSVGWCRRFATDHADWLGTYRREATDRACQQVPTLDDYRAHRRLSSGMLVFVDLVEVAAGVDLPARVRDSDAVRRLRDTTSEYMGLVNDMYSVDKERASGLVHNAVSVVVHHGCVPSDDALQVVADLASDCLRAFDDAAGHATGVSDIERCVVGYRRLMRGAVDCCANLDRYATPTGTRQGATT